MQIAEALENERLVLSLRALKNWPGDKAYYAATVNVIKKGRNLEQIVRALTMGASYRMAIKAGSWKPEAFLAWANEIAAFNPPPLTALDSQNSTSAAGTAVAPQSVS